MVHSDRKSGHVELARLLDALNAVDPMSRAVVLSALRTHDPANRYFTARDGRVSVPG